uniref:Uncharacterized protein n=1 Tax=Ditylenchus dipsaci TaxID=166011 RepID=A0A915EJ93_9BILA
MVDQMNWQQNALLTSLSNSMLAASAATIQSPDILRLRQVSLKDEEDLQQAVIAGLVGSGVAVREDCSRSTEEEELEDVNVEENSESEEQKQIEEEKRDEQPLDLSIRRNSKKKKALNRSFGEHPPPCTSTTPSPLRNSDFRNTVIHNGVLPQRSSCDIKRSASSVSHRANSTEPDVQDHFRRSLSGKWPRRTPNYAHPSPYYISNNATNNSSLASLSSAQSISNILNSDTSLTQNTTLPAAQGSMELGETAIEQLKLEGGPEETSGGISSYLYWRKKSLSSSGSICNPGTANFQTVANAPEMLDHKNQDTKGFNGMSNKANANRVETKIIINEGAKPVEDHFRKTFEMIKNGQLKSSENSFKHQFASPSGITILTHQQLKMIFIFYNILKQISINLKNVN